ncbi:MAG: phenylacetate-CoA oxygenase subunit PaaJ [Ignavibacteriales bacterium]|nr:phenylacetate-CoA oxygenase subunit PaaJ [Ignavibacteriales bacterium]
MMTGSTEQPYHKFPAVLPTDNLHQRVWEELSQVKDPEIPVLSLVDMKIIRRVEVNNADVTVVMTPTFAGCPALHLMKEEVRERLLCMGFKQVHVEVSLSEPWSTELLDDIAREKLAAFGIAPPARLQSPAGNQAHQDQLSESLRQPVQCPFCQSEQTRLESFF